MCRQVIIVVTGTHNCVVQCEESELEIGEESEMWGAR